jgi:putative NADH-flavin reductase
MRILVMGASSGIGAQVVRAAAARGHEVRAMARGIDPGAVRPGVENLRGDATDPDDVARAVAGVDAVVQALGVRESVATLLRPVTLFSTATEVLVPAMRAAGVPRLVAITGFGAGDSRRALSLPERLGHDLILGRVYADKTRQEELVKASALDWTIVRPTILTDGPAGGRYEVLDEPERWRNGLISRRDVAAFVVDMLERGAFTGRDVVVTR